MAQANTIPTSFSLDLIQGNVKQAMKDIGASSGDIWRCPVDSLVVMPGLNVRAERADLAAHIERTAQSILAEGFYPDKALAVFINADNQVVVRDGHNRLKAVKRAIELGAQITTVPCVTAPKGSTMEDYTIGLVKSNTGLPLQPIEIAVVCKRLVGWGWDVKKVAERLDYTPAYVNDLLGLLEAPAALQNLVSAGKVSASTAIKQTKKEGVAKATETLVAASATSKGGKVSAKTLKPAKVVLSPSTMTVVQAQAILKAVLNDKSFAKLSDSTQQRVLEVVG